MTVDLGGAGVAFVVANSGVEQVELTAPWTAVLDAGGRPVLIAPETGDVRALNEDVDPGEVFGADVAAADAVVDDYVGVVVPGGTINVDRLRLDKSAVELVAGFAAAGKPVAAICHGPWMLVEADVVAGKTLTSWPSLRTDISNAGGIWVDAEVFVCTAGPYPLITSRKPDDLAAFCDVLVHQLAHHSSHSRPVGVGVHRPA
jgi:protease I